MKNMHDKMQACFSEATMALLKRIGALGKSLGCKTYLVGGVVRDLLLGVENLDIDIVIEPDALVIETPVPAVKDAAVGSLAVVPISNCPAPCRTDVIELAVPPTRVA